MKPIVIYKPSCCELQVPSISNILFGTYADQEQLVYSYIAGAIRLVVDLSEVDEKLCTVHSEELDASQNMC